MYMYSGLHSLFLYSSALYQFFQVFPDYIENPLYITGSVSTLYYVMHFVIYGTGTINVQPQMK